MKYNTVEIKPVVVYYKENDNRVYSITDFQKLQVLLTFNKSIPFAYSSSSYVHLQVDLVANPPEHQRPYTHNVSSWL